ncbi:hypothetical protein KF7HA_00162 [Lactococcus lactis]|nr:hypothetical protein [Lactococcus lactis]
MQTSSHKNLSKSVGEKTVSTKSILSFDLTELVFWELMVR